MKAALRFRPPAGVVLTGLVILGLLAVTLMIVFLKKPSKPDLAAPESVHPVRVALVGAEPAADPLELPARVEPAYDAVLAAEKPGRIVEIAVDRGDRVAAGARLLQLDARVWEARLRQAEVEQRLVARDFERFRELHAAGALSGSDFDAAQARLERAEAMVAELRATVEQHAVVAPAAGVITDRFVESGEHANEGMPLLRLTDTSTIKIVADVPEREMGSAAVGDAIAFRVDFLPDETFMAQITFVSPTARHETQTFRVEATAPNPRERLPGGAIVRLFWPRRPVKGWWTLPLPAVIPRRGEHLVFVASEDGRAVRRSVTLEYLAGQRAVVSAGVAPGERLVVEGHRVLRDGALLQILNGAAPGDSASP